MFIHGRCILLTIGNNDVLLLSCHTSIRSRSNPAYKDQRRKSNGNDDSKDGIPSRSEIASSKTTVCARLTGL